MVGVPFEDDDARSTSTVASTAGTGMLSIASRQARLELEFGDRLNIEDTERIEEEADEELMREDASERTMNTTIAGETVDNDDGTTEDNFHHAASMRNANAFHICSKIFAQNGNVQLKRMSIRQVS